jgi:hypothetical protein
MVRRVRTGSWWIALLVVAGGGMAAAPRSGSAEDLDEAWFVSLVRAESLVTAASTRGEVDTADHSAVAEQIRLGVHVLGSVVHASIAADTLLVGPLAAVLPVEQPAGSWAHRILRATGVISAVTSLVHLVASTTGVGYPTLRVLAYVGGSAAGVGGVLDRWVARSPSRPASDPAERIHTLDLETDLRDSVHETERAAELLWVELRAMALDSCATAERVVWLARRYANALQEASVIVDFRVARSAAAARSCAHWPGFTAEARERCGTFASRLDAVGELWQERRWLVERSRNNALDYLVLADRPWHARRMRTR